MLSPTEREEIRQLIDRELADIEFQCSHAGSYTYLCQLLGTRVLTHTPVGRVLRHIDHPPKQPDDEDPQP